MRVLYIFIYIFIFCLIAIADIVQGQEESEAKVSEDTTRITSAVTDSGAASLLFQSPLLLNRKMSYQKPTMPPLRISEKQKRLDFSVKSERYRTPEEITNWDAVNMPTNPYDYEVTRDYFPPLVPITPLEVPDQEQRLLNYIADYHLPTRQEMDIFEILWLREEVMDTTIYSCLDHTLNITMADLNQLLDQMYRKRYIHRKQVSPRNEFNAFGVLIEMSPTNRRNRVYTYRSNVSRELMERFISANAYLFAEDSTIVNQKQLRAARNDSTLLRDLNAKIYQPVH